MFNAMELLCRTLQTSDINSQGARSVATRPMHFLKRQRSDKLLTTFYFYIVKEAENRTQALAWLQLCEDKDKSHSNFIRMLCTLIYQHNEVFQWQSTILHTLTETLL